MQDLQNPKKSEIWEEVALCSDEQLTGIKRELESFCKWVICKYPSHSFKTYLHNCLQLVMYIIETSFIEINFDSH